jgi:hypothetical protein
MLQHTALLIPGDTLQISGQAAQTVTNVVADDEVMVSPGVNSAISSSSPVALNSYSGYFINPVLDFSPPPGQTGYPGGALAITSHNGHGGVVWAVIPARVDSNASSPVNWSSEFNRTQGSLWAYGADPKSNGTRLGLGKVWDTQDNCSGCQTFCASPYTVPTVAQGTVFVGTCAINTDASQLCPTDTSPGTNYRSGILVYGIPQQ